MRLIGITSVVLFLSFSAVSAPFDYFSSSMAITNATEYKGEPCQTGSPYYTARDIGKQAYTDRHTLDFQELLIDVPPVLKDLYGECVELLGDIDSIIGLLNPSIYVNVASLEAIKKLIIQRVIDGVCSEIDELATEVYYDIADAIPRGEYAYHLDDLFQIEVSF